jgi:integrase/recombinase XerD
MDLQTLIDGYRLYCQAGGKSPHTIRWYMGKLGVFQEYLERQDELEVEKLTPQAIRAFVVHLQTEVRADERNPHKPARPEPLSPQTVQGYVRVLKAFFSWATREGLVQDNPTARVEVPKAPRMVVPTFTQAQIEAFLSVIDRSKPTGYRDYCIVLTLLDTGVRLSELIGLDLSTLDLE